MTSPDVLSCEHLMKRFGGVQPLNDVNLKCQSHSIVAVVGPNGAGKTTLLNALSGFLEPDSGRVFLGGVDVTKQTAHARAAGGIARNFQDLRLIPTLSALEHLMLVGSPPQSDWVWAGLNVVGVKRREEHQRETGRSVLTKTGLGEQQWYLPVSELSYGDQKMISLAIAFAPQSDVVLLDEPVAGLHEEQRRIACDSLVDLKNAGRMVLFVEHDLSVVRRIADRLIVMDEGSIIADGMPADVLERSDVVEAFVS